MRALELILVLSVTVANVLAPPPPPPPPPMPIDPEQPTPEVPGGPPPVPPQMPTGGCEPDYSCPSTYEIAVLGDDPCQAAQVFKECTELAQSFCTGVVPSNVVALTEGAQRAVEDKCDVAETYPACANMCLSYENSGEADWADSKQQSGCDQYQRYLTCLQNFENSGSCKVTSFLEQANTRYNEQCQSS